MFYSPRSYGSSKTCTGVAEGTPWRKWTQDWAVCVTQGHSFELTVLSFRQVTIDATTAFSTLTLLFLFVSQYPEVGALDSYEVPLPYRDSRSS